MVKRSVMRKLLGWTLVGMLMAGAVAADPVTGKAAKAMLFSTTAVQVVINTNAGLPKNMAGALKTVLAGQPAYGAAAISPDEGLMSDATIFVGNFHDAANQPRDFMNNHNAGIARLMQRILNDTRPQAVLIDDQNG